MSSVKDRLKDLEKKVELKPENAKLVNEFEKENKKLKRIFDKVEDLREKIDAIKGNTERTKEALDNFYRYGRQESHAEIQSLFDAFTKKAKAVTDALKEFETDVEKQKKNYSAEARIKLLQCASLKKEFQTIIEENSAIIQKYQNHMSDLYKKSIKITFKDATEDELNELLTNKDMMQIFIKNHLIETEIVMKELDELNSRREQLLSLEQQIRDVHDLFLQISILVEQQQESLDRVEFHALNAQQRVEHVAIGILPEVKKRAKRNRKMKIFIILGIIIIILVLLIILLK